MSISHRDHVKYIELFLRFSHLVITFRLIMD